LFLDAGELYSCHKAGSDGPVVKPTQSSSSPPSSSSSSSNMVDKDNWDQKEVVVHYDAKRCPMVHRGVRIFTDIKSKVFAVLLADPSIG